METSAKPSLGRTILRNTLFVSSGGGLIRFVSQHVPSFTVWVEDVDKGLVPQQVIEAISAWLEQEQRVIQFGPSQGLVGIITNATIAIDQELPALEWIHKHIHARQQCSTVH